MQLLSYESVDQLQNLMAKEIFGDRKDAKKASGRALGTIVEIITYYLLESWGLANHLTIEEGVLEYGNKSISHNIEYMMHPTTKSYRITLSSSSYPITGAKILSAISAQGVKSDKDSETGNALLSSDGVLRNSCLIATVDGFMLMATVESVDKVKILVRVDKLHPASFGMVECKRVGVEEGMGKGPQTIEKAKQGAYVAKAISSLQKIRDPEGTLYGTMFRKGNFYTRPYSEMIAEVISSNDPSIYKDFILTIGVVSNHGNWFTSGNQNKELRVLAQSYDWLIFLHDKGMLEFYTDLLSKPSRQYTPVREAFLASYEEGRSGNRFTKVKMEYGAHLALLEYFKTNREKIANWFNIITPKGVTLSDLQNQLKALADKERS
jgi:hypothetical protein